MIVVINFKSVCRDGEFVIFYFSYGAVEIDDVIFGYGVYVIVCFDVFG